MPGNRVRSHDLWAKSVEVATFSSDGLAITRRDTCMFPTATVNCLVVSPWKHGGFKKIEERGIHAASRFKFTAGVAKSENVRFFHI